MPNTNFGVLLRRWREVRHVSQLDLSLDAEISTRHLSCVETGRAQPSREMVVRLARHCKFRCASAMRCCSRPAMRRFIAAVGVAPRFVPSDEQTLLTD